jgi:lysophospholipase L1-like esterase
MTSSRRISSIGQVAASVAAVLGVMWLAPASGQQSNARWVTAWSTSQQILGEDRITNATVRMIARVTTPGDAVRVRLDNAYGTEPVTIGRAFVGHRVRGAALAAGSNRPLTFKGGPEAIIPAGGTLSSDPVPLAVHAQQDLAVSLHIRGTGVRPSQHTNAAVTSYRSADGSGDVTADEAAMRFEMTTTALWWLKAVDVQSASAGSIVAFGDSITDGTCSTLDAHDRWQDVVSLRLGLEHEAVRQGRGARDEFKAVINEGIGGNTITREGLTPPPDSTPGLERLERDVLSHHGVTDVVLFMGTNDIRRGASAASVIEGTSSIVKQVKAKGFRIIGATIIPRHNVPPSGTNTGWNPEKTRIRNQVNEWIRTKAPFDAVIDFERVVRDPSNPDLLVHAFNCGDGIHPSPLGYYEMGKSVDLSLFRRR